MQAMNLEITKATRCVLPHDRLGSVSEKLKKIGITEETIPIQIFYAYLSLLKSICSADGYDKDVGGSILQRFDPDFVYPCPAIGQNVPVQNGPFASIATGIPRQPVRR